MTDIRPVCLIVTADREPFKTRRQKNAEIHSFLANLMPTYYLVARQTSSEAFVEDLQHESSDDSIPFLVVDVEETWCNLPQKMIKAFQWVVEQGYTHLVKIDDDTVLADTHEAAMQLAQHFLRGTAYASANTWTYRKGDPVTYHVDRCTPDHSWFQKAYIAEQYVTVGCGNLYMVASHVLQQYTQKVNWINSMPPLEDLCLSIASARNGVICTKLDIGMREGHFDDSEKTILAKSFPTSTADDMPFFSIVICTTGRFSVSASIQSALTIDDCGKGMEIILVDDRRNKSLPFIYPKHPRLRVVDGPLLGWCGPSRNVGWRAARGEWIHFLDDDDFLHPNICKWTLEHLDVVPNVDVLVWRAAGKFDHLPINAVVPPPSLVYPKLGVLANSLTVRASLRDRHMYGETILRHWIRELPKDGKSFQHRVNMFPDDDFRFIVDGLEKNIQIVFARNLAYGVQMPLPRQTPRFPLVVL